MSAHRLAMNVTVAKERRMGTPARPNWGQNRSGILDGRQFALSSLATPLARSWTGQVSIDEHDPRAVVISRLTAAI